MKNYYVWTALKARLKRIRTIDGSNDNWLFLPGGPGLGAESLTGLTDILSVPGTLWHLDLPGDGSNTTDDDSNAFSQWQAALIEATSALDNVILVGHSTGGMFALATAALEKILKGIVLMDSAPDARWQETFNHYIANHPLANVDNLQKIYEKHPSNEALKNLTLACIPWFSTPQSLKENISLFETLPYNYKSYAWAAQYFDPYYKAAWIPRSMPALIFAGEKDPMTPLRLFAENPDFQRENIILHEIKNASHFPWYENPNEVIQVFKAYYHQLYKT